jgi:DNA-directed RNA polymerase subunit beta'
MDTTLIKQMIGAESGSNFSQVTISLASPEVITSWSRGEIKNPETINYRTFKPEKGGLFCERIFGPTKDWECNCGKYKRIKHKGIVCDRCGVEVTQSRVRRERMGHIDLAVPVSHIWFFKCMPSRLGLVLDMTARALERIIYYEDWIIIDEGDTPLQRKQILTDTEYREAQEMYGESFQAGMGAAAVKELLRQVDPEALLEQLTAEMAATRSKANHKKIAKRMRLMEGFIENGTKPEWMIIETLPVIPPDLRPLVPLEGGRFATSDLNDLYRRVINRNNRLKNLLHLRTPEVIIRNEKRMLQEAVDALLDNGRHGRAVTGAGNRQLKSLCDMLKGKSGRFRQNLLGKRVDYSGRSVIVVGPELKLHQCGLPKQMALVLFEPFIIRRLKEQGIVHTVRSAKKMIERGAIEVWDVLEEVTKGHPVLLNRAPTLHRLSIQAFDPVLIEGKAIRVHPLVCASYNADFDGDQMAVHVPLSNEAQLEAKLLMLSPNNIFSPANGKPLCTPTQDMTLGCYFLTYWDKKNESVDSSKLTVYNDISEVLWAMDVNICSIHDLIRFKNPDYGKKTIWGNTKDKYIATTPGRIIFWEIWPSELGFYNKQVVKKTLSKLISECHEELGRSLTVNTLDGLKRLGFQYATKSGFSVATVDMIIPQEKYTIVESAQKEIDEVREQFIRGSITEKERYNKCIDIWTNANAQVKGLTFKTIQHNMGLKEINSIWAMLDSGARGSQDQIRQLAGMRGLMAKPNGTIIERPIKSNFREGLTVLEYFISSHGARKGLADTALKTADSGYMTRKLVDVAQDVICTIEDCGTTKGIWVKAIREGDDDMLPLVDRIIGRMSVDNIHDPLSADKKVYLVKANQEITADIADAIVDRGIESVHIRSVLTCDADTGVCVLCYGRLLANDTMTKIGDAIGILAAQSIGEPGTQLTMRTFHVGGVAATTFKTPSLKAKADGKLVLIDAVTIDQEDGTLVVINKNGKISLESEEGIVIESHDIVAGTQVLKKIGAKVKKDQIYAKWDPHNMPIITENAGRVEYRDLVLGVTLERKVKTSGEEEITVLEHRDDLHPQLAVVNKKGEIIAHYSLPAGAHINVQEGENVVAGEFLAKIPRQAAKTKDITGGLPRVAELFEARKPKEKAFISKIDGVVETGRRNKNKQALIIRDPENGQIDEQQIPTNRRVTVTNGEFVKKGTLLTDGAVDLQEMLEVCGPQELQEYLANEVQEVYRLQSVEINDKHVEVIVRQMLRKVRVTDSGTTRFLTGEEIDKKVFQIENERVIAEGGQPAEGQALLLGITKASLSTESFISAASFQDTTRILTDAATLGKVDNLKGFKENVIMGHLIPAGTGLQSLRDLKVIKEGGNLLYDSEQSDEVQSDKLASAKAMLSLDD